MNTASSALRLALSTLALCSLAGCAPAPELMPADPVAAEDAWVDSAAPVLVHTRDGLTVAAPDGFNVESATARVPGGVSICSEEAGLAVYDEKSGAWTRYGWGAELPKEAGASCTFDARSLTEAWLWAPSSDVTSSTDYLCHSSAGGWSCAQTGFYEPTLKLTETKLWVMGRDWDSVFVMDATADKGVDEANAKEISFEDEYLWGDIQVVPGADAVFTFTEDHVLQVEGGSMKKLDIHTSLPRSGGYVPVAVGLDHYYIVASHADVETDCDGQLLHFHQCHTTVAHSSEVQVVEIDGDDATTVGKHQEDGVEWFATGVLQDGELRVSAGNGWYRLP